MPNTSEIILELIDADGAWITDRIEVRVQNRRCSQFDQTFRFHLEGGRVRLPNIPAAPDGAAQLTIQPASYRPKSIFIDVPAGAPLTVREQMFVDPIRVMALFPQWNDIHDTLRRLLAASGIDKSVWEGLPLEHRASVFNVWSKSWSVTLDDGSLFQTYRRILGIKPARCLIVVDPDLQERLVNRPLQFREECGALHQFPQGWQRLPEHESFKTRDDMGNLQLTFARDTSREGLLVADVDLDDHAGIRHAFDVMKHTLSGKDTHPYDIHQILRCFQGIYPGYRLAPAGHLV
ncbi:MAG: hypothetical protein U0Q16_36420 [Bryobacteraceae bacterium]